MNIKTGLTDLLHHCRVRCISSRIITSGITLNILVQLRHPDPFVYSTVPDLEVVKGAVVSGLSPIGASYRTIFDRFCRAMIYKGDLSRHAVSVRQSRSYILSKRINVSSNFFYHRVATPF